MAYPQSGSLFTVSRPKLEPGVLVFGVDHWTGCSMILWCKKSSHRIIGLMFNLLLYMNTFTYSRELKQIG